jgi:DNA-binding GntR family transcriptional regulator
MLKIKKSPNLTELAYLSVKQSLFDGSAAEGTKLTEESLASQLGISKSPVREALNRLESEGLVSIEARRGAYVRKFSLKEVTDLYDLREVLEVHAVGLAKITPTLLRQLRESVEHTEKHLDEKNVMAHVDEDVRFHNLIAAATANEELRRVVENINQKSLLCRSKTYHLSASTAPLSHGRILRALEDGNRQVAQQAMREHILFVRDSLLRFLEGKEANHVADEDASLTATS